MSALEFRTAVESDIPTIVALLADDPLGRHREAEDESDAAAYRDAFAAIAADPNQRLVVAVDGAHIVGTLQLSFIPGLSHKGAWRGQIEGVRIVADRRNAGLGRRLIEWAVDQCRSRNCKLVQFTTDRRRPDAHRFYERLGFTATHVGFKLSL